MNLGQWFRDGVDRLPAALEAMSARINTVWKKQHNPITGAHTDITAGSVTTSELNVGQYTGTLLPTFSAALTGRPLLYVGDPDAGVPEVNLLSNNEMILGAEAQASLVSGTAVELRSLAAGARIGLGAITGNPVIDTFGRIDAQSGQITFPSTQNPSTDGNTLDDYEEGTWVPTNPFIAFAAAVGHYTKVGRLVHVEVVVVWPVTADANNATFTMPFVLGAGASAGAGGIAWNAAAITCFNMATIGSNVASILNLGGGPLTNAAMSGLGVRFNASYETD